MTIHIDAELKKPENFASLSADKKYVIDQLRLFVFNRLKVLEEDITKEESTRNAHVILCIMENPLGLAYNKFSDGLKTKITACFTTQDWEYIQIKIANDLGLL